MHRDCCEIFQMGVSVKNFLPPELGKGRLYTIRQ